jgi:hypothetical protein
VPRGPWLKVALGAAVAALFAGRWLAVYTSDHLWAESLGAGAVYADIALRRLMLGAGAGLVAVAWFLGNLLLVYRQIGAVQVPRRVGDLEFVEHVPRRYLLGGAIVIALVLGVVTSIGADDWWTLRALAALGPIGGPLDPILQRDPGYYLLRLPWLRAVQGFVQLAVGVALALLVLLYAAIGAVRRQDRRLVCTPFARWHLAVLLATTGLVLAWGYVLEPAELVGGVESVPFDGVLTGVRLPVARTLTVIAAGAGGVSLVWGRVERTSLLAGAWGLWLAVTFVGHYLLPGAVAAARGAERRAVPGLAAAAEASSRTALALRAESLIVPLAVPDQGFVVRHRATLAATPVWDAFVLTAVLNRAARPAPSDPRSDDRFFDATLITVPGGWQSLEPVFLAVREPDSVDQMGGRGPPWAARHGDPAALGIGAVAVHATRVAEGGRPLYIPAIGTPDAVTPQPSDLALAADEIWFGPSTSGFAVVAPDRGPIGVPAGGWWRRLALAWTLQSPSLLSRNRVPASAIVVAERTVPARLGRLAPFAEFGAAFPAVAEGRVIWIATGYVAGEAYPLARSVVWRGRRVRYLHAGLLGTVDATTGATSVYLAPDADPISRAWMQMFPDLIRPAGALPAALASQLRYPEELFTAQLQLLRGAPGRARVVEPYWWVGPSVGDPAVRLRLRVVDEVQVESRVAAVIEGVVEGGRPRLRVLRYPEPYALSGPADLERGFRDAAPAGVAVGGRLRFVPYEDGAVALQAFYADSGTLDGVVAGWRGVIGRGRTVTEAIDRLIAAPQAGGGLAAATPYEAAREWFRRLDRARAAGDWRAFGEAWAGLRAALGLVGAESAAGARQD